MRMCDILCVWTRVFVIYISNVSKQAFEIVVCLFYFPSSWKRNNEQSTITNTINSTTDCSIVTRKAQVDKIHMKSSSRSNTYVQNVKFRLFCVKSHFNYNQKARYEINENGWMS